MDPYCSFVNVTTETKDRKAGQRDWIWNEGNALF